MDQGYKFSRDVLEAKLCMILKSTMYTMKIDRFGLKFFEVRL